jgi:hypothetical protein
MVHGASWSNTRIKSHSPLYNLKAEHCCHRDMPLYTTLTQFNPVIFVKTYIIITRFNIAPLLLLGTTHRLRSRAHSSEL